MECILASIFDGFWWFLGAKLGAKIEEKSILKGIEKMMNKTSVVFDFLADGGARNVRWSAWPAAAADLF